MNWLIIKNDLKRNKGIHFALWCFMTLSAMLAVLSVIVAVQTFSSISNLYSTAQPPHFLQMHKGEMDESAIADFMESHEEVIDWQIVTMIDIYGDNLTIGNTTLTDCRIDLGLVKQNLSKDLLLNAAHEKVELNQGEIGIPVLLKEQYDIKIGDKVTINCDGITKEFIVKEFVLDAQMNSSMCSSTRILLSDEDYNALVGTIGEEEYLIEAYFKDSGESGSFQTTYETAGLPQNGQAITYTMIFLLSALTDIITVFVLVFVSILLIAVAFLCVKYTILAALEEELGEIGTMKAIGISNQDIREIYFMKYRFLSMTGVIAGYLLAIVSSNMVTGHISETFGKSKPSILLILLSVVMALFVNFIINHRCKHILERIRKLTVVDALVTQSGFSKLTGKTKDGLSKAKNLPVNVLVGIREVVQHFQQWWVVFLTVVFVVILVVIPSNVVKTMEDREFITYMGSSVEDIMIEVENGTALEENTKKVRKVLKEDSAAVSVSELKRVCVQTTDSEGNLLNLHVDCGEQAGEGLEYLTGTAPKGDNEIALSYLNAETIGVKSGDSIVVFAQENQETYVISGIYQDITSGGYTAKMKQKFPELSAEKYSFLVRLDEGVSTKQIANEWAELMGNGVNVDPMEEFLHQTLGGVITQLHKLVFTIAGIGAFLTILIIVLFLRLRLAKDKADIAVMKAVGFNHLDLVKQYLTKIESVVAVGIIAGIVISRLFGRVMINLVLEMSGLGIKEIQLMMNPWMAYLICPGMILGLAAVATIIVMNLIRRYRIMSIVNE